MGMMTQAGDGVSSGSINSNSVTSKDLALSVIAEVRVLYHLFPFQAVVQAQTLYKERLEQELHMQP